MIYQVIGKQNNAKMCFVCGIENKSGLHTHFYELNDGRLVGLFKGHDVHQSYPERMHGGIITALLDETIGRALQVKDPNSWGVTIEVTTKFIKPVPLDQELKVVGWITSDRRLIFEGEGYICDEKNEILATCTAKYMKKSVDNIVNENEFLEEEWFYVEDPDGPTSFDLPK